MKTIFRIGRGVKVGFFQAGTENERVGLEMIEGLLERGLKVADGLLCVIDGSKGLRKALYEVLGGGQGLGPEMPMAQERKRDWLSSEGDAGVDEAETSGGL